MKCFFCALVALLASVTAAQAEQRYVPQSLYSFQRVEFGNGFRAMLNPRKGANYVSMRLVVGTGSGDFDCVDRELPHLVEHLLFSGTSQYNEAELEELVASLGGYQNALTMWDATAYEMDMFSGNASRGVEILHQLFTDTEISEDELKSAREVVYLESGGAPSAIQQFLHGAGIIEGSIDKAARQFIPESGVYCSRIPTTEHIDVADIERYRQQYHVPRNMMFIAVGNFDAAQLKRVLAQTFGTLPDVAPGGKQSQPAIDFRQRRRVEYNTRLDPLLKSTTYVSLDFQVVSDFGRERAATTLIAKYLDERLYEELRVNRGLAYAPAAIIQDLGDFAALTVEAEVDNANADAAVEVMEALVRSVSEEGVEEDALARLKQSMLYEFTQKFEANNSIAELYASFGRKLLDGKALPDYQADIESLDTDFVRTVAAERLRTDRALVYVQAPTLGYGQLAGIIIAVVLLAGWFGYTQYRRRRS